MSRTMPGALAAVVAAAAFGCLIPVSAMHLGDEMKWGDAPPALPKGAKAAVLQGDPTKAGQFVLRLHAPSGYKVPPHMHSIIENVTVIKGTLMLVWGISLMQRRPRRTMRATLWRFQPRPTTTRS